MSSELCAVGVDLGGTKILAALVDATGLVRGLMRHPTDVEGGPEAVREQIIGTVNDLRRSADAPILGVGVGVAGQIAPRTGVVHFAPNLAWHDVPLQQELQDGLGLPVVVTNDVRAATWGEWLYGAGRGCDDLICIYVGTGIGGGVVSGGRMLDGCGNTAGEIGHITVDLNGPSCTCGNRGCFEALAGGWAIELRTRAAVQARPEAGATLMALAGGKPEAITARILAQAFRAGDELANRLLDEVSQALVAGAASLVNAFNPCRLIVGGGIIQGFPELVERIDVGVRHRALTAATAVLQVVSAQLGNDAGAIGAAALAMRSFMDVHAS